MRRALLFGLAGLCAACGDEPGNPFANTSASRPPASDAAILYVSGAWSNEDAAPRELFALAADGSNPQQLTTCARASQPCDILQVAPGPDRNRVLAVRTTPDAEPGAQILYFMDLARSVESIIFDRRRVDSADWALDGSFLLFASPNAQNGNEDLFTSQPNGADEQNLTQSLNVRERHARLDPLGRNAVFERIDEAGVSRVYLFRETPITSGPATGPALPGTPYVVGSDADPTFSPDAAQLVFRRLTGVGNGGLGTWDLLVVSGAANSVPRTLASGPVARGAPDWGRDGIVFVETDAAAGTASLVRIQPDGTGRTVLRTEPATARMGAPRWLR
jgi:Tol biopolymer transport system component